METYMTRDARTAQLKVARQQLLDWIKEERTYGSDQKYGEGQSTRDEYTQAVRDGYGLEDRWLDFVFNYVQRAKMFGLATPKGRQALGKAIVTLMHYLETAIVEHGDMPQPGRSSTADIVPWERES